MPPRFLSFAFATTFFFASLGATYAQRHDYRVDLADGTSGEIIITNYYSQPLESLHFKGSCGNGAMSFDSDILDSENQPQRVPILNARGEAELFAPGERAFHRSGLPPQPSGCAWSYELTAVLFADGTWQGDEAAARALAARRDGLRDGARFWSEKLAAQFKLPLPDPKAMSDQDQPRTFSRTCEVSAVACSYWSGWLQVERNIALRAGDRVPQKEVSQRQLAEAARWQQKAEKIESTAKFDALFPVPPELVEAAAQRRTDYPVQKPTMLTP